MKTLAPAPLCPKCGADDETMIEVVSDGIRDSGLGIRDSGFGARESGTREPATSNGRILDPGSRIPSRTYFCNICSHDWTVPLRPAGRFRSIEDVVQRTGLRRDELTTLADIGALNAFTNERRSALWQVERAVRPSGELFRDSGLGIRESGVGTRDSGVGTRDSGLGSRDSGLGIRDSNRNLEPGTWNLEPGTWNLEPGTWNPEPGTRNLDPESRIPAPESPSPLRAMDPGERLQADYAGMGLTIGPHPMALRRGELSLRGVMRASDLPGARNGRRVRVAGMVITRQRPGTAKGFVFLTLEDETGISNIIIRPDLFDRERMLVIRQPFLIVDGVLQHQDGVLSVRAEKVEGIEGDASIDAHDFY
jgi:error-prone DNA polymerase